MGQYKLMYKYYGKLARNAKDAIISTNICGDQKKLKSEQLVEVFLK